MEECHDVRLVGWLFSWLVAWLSRWLVVFWVGEIFIFITENETIAIQMSVQGEWEQKKTISLTIKWQIGLDFHLTRQLFLWYPAMLCAMIVNSKQYASQPPNSLMCLSPGEFRFVSIQFSFSHNRHIYIYIFLYTFATKQWAQSPSSSPYFFLFPILMGKTFEKQENGRSNERANERCKHLGVRFMCVHRIDTWWP